MSQTNLNIQKRDFSTVDGTFELTRNEAGREKHIGVYLGGGSE